MAMARATLPGISWLLDLICSLPIFTRSGFLPYSGTPLPRFFLTSQIIGLANELEPTIPEDIPFFRRLFLGYSKVAVLWVQPSEKTVFRLCDAVTDFIFYFLDKGAPTNSLNPKCSELGDCYKRKIKNTVLSKFQYSVKLVIPELSGFLKSFRYEVCSCMVCVPEDAHICRRHQKCMSDCVKKLNGKISESFGVENQLFFRSWVNENGIKLEDHERHQYRTMQFLITNLLLVFKSLMQHMVWYLIHTKVKTETECLSQFEFELFSQYIMYLLVWCYLFCLFEFRNFEWNPGELQDRVQSLVVKGGEILMGKRFDEPLEVRTLEENASSVVCISNSEGCGSGLVWDDLGHIVTNYHVIDGAPDHAVTFDDKSTCEALLVGFDEDKDIAVLRVPKENLRPLSHGDSSKLRCGDKVTAISNLFGMYPGSCTAGIISSVGRDIEVESIVEPIQNFIQTDAASSLGSSGGALLNQFGELIGMITRVQETFSDASGGVAFAIPVDSVVDVVRQLLSNDGKVERPFLGILCGPELPVKMKKLGMKGVAVKDAPNKGPAERKRKRGP